VSVFDNVRIDIVFKYYKDEWKQVRHYEKVRSPVNKGKEATLTPRAADRWAAKNTHQCTVRWSISDYAPSIMKHKQHTILYQVQTN